MSIVQWTACQDVFSGLWGQRGATCGMYLHDAKWISDTGTTMIGRADMVAGLVTGLVNKVSVRNSCTSDLGDFLTVNGGRDEPCRPFE